MLRQLGNALQLCVLQRTVIPPPYSSATEFNATQGRGFPFCQESRRISSLLLWRGMEIFGQGVFLLTQCNSSTLMQPAYHLLLPGAWLCVFVSPSPLSWLIHASSIIDGRSVSGGAWWADRVLAAASVDAQTCILVSCWDEGEALGVGDNVCWDLCEFLNIKVLYLHNMFGKKCLRLLQLEVFALFHSPSRLDSSLSRSHAPRLCLIFFPLQIMPYHHILPALLLYCIFLSLLHHSILHFVFGVSFLANFRSSTCYFPPSRLILSTVLTNLLLWSL